MIKAMSISIPEPCHEDWDKMTPNEKGRFCSLCAKTVVDFSTMTDNQVLHYLLDKRDQKICGRALPEQLDTPMALPTITKRRPNWLRHAAAALVFMFAKSATAKAQQKEVKTEQVPVTGNNNGHTRGKVVLKPVKTEMIQLTGKVTNLRGEAIAGATISKYNGKNVVSSDMNGMFKIAVKKGDELQVSALGYQGQVYTVYSSEKCVIVLHEKSDLLLGELVIIGPPRKKRQARNIPAVADTSKLGKGENTDSGLSKLLIPVLAGNNKITTYTAAATNLNESVDVHAVNIYPNPVPRGNTMQLLWVMKQKGPHIVLVNDAAGLLVWQQQVISPAKNSKTTIPVNAGWSAGVYRLRIVNESGKVISENSFIVQ